MRDAISLQVRTSNIILCRKQVDYPFVMRGLKTYRLPLSTHCVGSRYYDSAVSENLS